MKRVANASNLPMQGITHIAPSPRFTLQRAIDKRYTVLETMGRRQWERTYLAIDTHSPDQRRCVVKEFCLHHNSVQTLQAIKARFEYEKTWMIALGNYDPVAHLLDLIVTEHAIYLIREFVVGEPLIFEETGGDRWTEPQVEALLIELLTVLQFVHSKAGIHGNLHPGNIIRRQSDGRCVLTDVCAISAMGLLLAEVQLAEVTPGKLNRLGYFATEQLWQRSRPNSDLFSLGMVCIHFLTGKRPWDLPRDPHTGHLVWSQDAAMNSRLAKALTTMTCECYRDRAQSAYDVLKILNASSSTQRFIAKVRRKQQRKTALRDVRQRESSTVASTLVSVPPVTDSPWPERSPWRMLTPEAGAVAIAASVLVVAGGSLALSRPETLLLFDPAPKILQQAAQQYQQGNIETAIATASAIAPESPSFLTAQQSIQQWQHEWDQSVQRFRELEIAYDAQDWLGVLRNGRDIPATDFWNAQKAPFMQQAQQQVDLQGHAVLQDAFNLAYQHQFVEALDALRRIPPEAAAYAHVSKKFIEYEEKRDIRAQYYLQQAYNDAQRGHFAQAIAYLQRITPETPTYAIAQRKQLEYRQKQELRANTIF